MGWAIFGIVLGAILLIVFIILMLPLYVILRSDDDGSYLLYGRILWFEFGKEPDPDSTLAKAFSEVLGISQIKKSANPKEEVGKAETVKNTTRQIVNVLTSLLKQVIYLLGFCTVTRFRIKVVSSGEDAASTAIEHGVVSAVVYSLKGYIDSTAKVKKNATKINLSCDFNGGKEEVYFDVRLFVRVHKVIKALFALVKENIEKEVYR